MGHTTVVQHHAPWVVQCCSHSWGMDCMIPSWVMFPPWPMGCITLFTLVGYGLYNAFPGNVSPMAHGLYNAFLGDVSPMPHGLYDTFHTHGSWCQGHSHPVASGACDHTNRSPTLQEPITGLPDARAHSLGLHQP